MEAKRRHIPSGVFPIHSTHCQYHCTTHANVALFISLSHTLKLSYDWNTALLTLHPGTQEQIHQYTTEEDGRFVSYMHSYKLLIYQYGFITADQRSSARLKDMQMFCLSQAVNNVQLFRWSGNQSYAGNSLWRSQISERFLTTSWMVNTIHTIRKNQSTAFSAIWFVKKVQNIWCSIQN